MKRLAAVLLFLSACAHGGVRPDYYTPERCFELKDTERTADTVETVAERLALGFAAGGVASEALKEAGINTGPLTLIGAGVAVLAGAVGMGAKSSGTSAAKEHAEYCTAMPVPVVPESAPQ